MDFWFVAVSALLLFSPDPVKTENVTSSNSTTTAPTPPPCPTPVLRSSPPYLGFLKVDWEHNCSGTVVFIRLDIEWKRHVCSSSRSRVEALLSGACEGRGVCRGDEKLQAGQEILPGLDISEGHPNETLCQILMIQCPAKEKPHLPVKPQEPVGFRVATALLSVCLILLLLLCFCKPTVKALQKRLSNKRKNRWVGPTQSHSVSYHRGQNVKNLDGQKDSSYPALDRLVLGAREPSSNRNSYNL